MATTEQVFTGARASEASRCPRMAAYTEQGVIPAPAGSHLDGLWERGHDLEDVYFRKLAEEYSGPIIRQHEVPWGDGWVAHVDGLLPDDDRRHVEVKSTTSPDTLPGCNVEISGVKSKSSVIQVAFGTVFDAEGGTAEVATISPVDYKRRRFPVTITPDIEGAVREIADRVIHAARTGELPPRPCRTPADGIARFCPHIQTCFTGWEPDDPIELGEEVATLAESLLDVTGQLRVASDREKELKAEQSELRDRLRGWIAPDKTYHVAGIELRVTSVKGRETLSLKDALAAGAVTEDQVAPFVKIGQPSERWSVAIDDDAGAEA
jgi:hypothetical protein